MPNDQETYDLKKLVNACCDDIDDAIKHTRYEGADQDIRGYVENAVQQAAKVEQKRIVELENALKEIRQLYQYNTGITESPLGRPAATATLVPDGEWISKKRLFDLVDKALETYKVIPRDDRYVVKLQNGWMAWERGCYYASEREPYASSFNTKEQADKAAREYLDGEKE